MGRKIPGKKHRGVKDPTKQQKKRLSELNKVINAPPRDKDEQAIPKSLERVMKLKQSVKDGKMMKKNTKKKTKLKNQLIVMGNHHPQIAHPKARPEKVVPVFSQRPDECGKAFLNRVNSETQAFINETAFEDKYGVEVKRDPSTGNIEGLSKRSKDEIDELMRLKLKHSNTKKKKKKKKDTETTRLTKAQKRKHKLELKKTKKLQDNIDEFKVFKETIEFGDVVHAPPELKIKPKKADASHSERPGRRRLLLDSLFKSHDKSAENPTGVKSVNRSGKRKDLPVGERRQLEERQKEAITAYRNLKSRKAADL
ncbi:coiled-coil domain-containing protein 137 [Neodiprion pinetum]|uniref:coiled-coil domain-containing protein 137 n=1 Tax=Neodiprion pinetum TaxID=441929 RepID=UPI001EDEDBC4|nr:coiled-coil domain-containing protein 137 [Neodiprion pinetum]